ncbi:MAG TPA: hypothetical protein VFN13_01230 [Rudaea sp.]|nr:hypothetical protein [Rudaea sp.]
MPWPFSVLITLFWFGPAGAVLLLSLVMEQHRDAPNGTKPEGNLVLRSLLGGVVAALVWVILVGALLVITGSGNAALWIVVTPWVFAIGQTIGLFSQRSNATRQ